MKKYLLTTFILSALFAGNAIAQTNTFPTSGKVGIGTTSPAVQLTTEGATGIVASFGNSATVSERVYSAFCNRAFFGYNGTTTSVTVQGTGGKGIEFNVDNSSFGLGQAMVIKPTGRVGVGTTDPQGLFHINSATTDMSYVRLTNASTGPASTDGFLLGYTSGLDAVIRNRENGKINFFTNDVQTMVLDASGNLCIGATPTPSARLAVEGTALFGDGVYSNIDPASSYSNLNFLKNTGRMLIGWNRTAGSGETDFIANQGGGNVGGFAFYNYNNSGNETQLMWIRGDGRVGIGGDTPADYKLGVNGGIIATSVTVKLKNEWPDYVFKKSYQLPSLQEIKRYIDQNGHLPDMPSANEVAAKGLDIGEVNKQLTKKVEELTLYAIQKETQLNDQQKQINALEQQLKALSLQVNLLNEKK